MKRWWSFLFPGSGQCWFCSSFVSRRPLQSIWQEICSECKSELHRIQAQNCFYCGRQRSMDRQSEICLDCEQASHRLINRSVVEYSAFAKQLIWLYKFRGDQSLAEPIGRMMAENVQINWQKKSFIITYVPLTSERLLERGFNQAQLLAEVIGSQLRMPVIPLLKREHFIGAQSQKGRVERIQSLTNAFSVLEEVSLMLWVDRPVLIVDDIYTTGTTLRECAKPLQIAGVEEICTTTFAR